MIKTINVKTNLPLISIILPIYNIEAYLDKCMQSLFKQTYKNIEIIMVDDGSTDSCGRLCDEYKLMDNRVRVFHKQNGGLSDARNYGITHSLGDYITCIDPDDYVDEDYIEYLYSLLARSNTKMSICQHRVVFDSGKIIEYGRTGSEILSNKKCIERMLYHDVIDTSAWAKLYHRDLFKNVKYPKGKIFEDIGTTYKLMLQCEYIAVGYESKYNYIVRSNSIVNSVFKLNKLDLLEMTDEMGKDVVSRYPDLEKAVLRRRIYARFSTLNQMLDVKNHIDKKKEIIKFILDNKKCVMDNSKTPFRDKIAILLLSINYPLYKYCWKKIKSK